MVEHLRMGEYLHLMKGVTQKTAVVILGSARDSDDSVDISQ